MKKLLIALVMAGILSGAVYGAAAAITVNGGVLQTGTGTNTTCDTSVDVEWVDTDNDLSTIEQVTVSDIAAACVGDALQVTAQPGGQTCTVASIALTSETCTFGIAAPTATTTDADVIILG